MIFLQIGLYTIVSGMFYTILSMGFGFNLRSVRFFNLAYGGAFLIGGYGMFLFYRLLHIHFALSFLLSLTVAGLYLALAHKFVFSPLLARRAKPFVSLIASFGLLVATAALLGMIFGSQSTLLARRLSDIYVIEMGGVILNIVQISGIILVPIIVCFFAYVRVKTRFGVSIRAVEDDAEVAELSGIPKEKVILRVSFIAGALAGLAGIIEGFDAGIIPASGLIYLFPAIVATIVGGMRSFWGGILGAFILAIAQQLTIVFFGGSWVQAVPFIILIIVLFIRPEGILNR
jgi:branched-subunit amino acid ABC-type transport system permease component